MLKRIILLSFISYCHLAYSQINHSLFSDRYLSYPSYEEIIKWYSDVSKNHKEVSLIEAGLDNNLNKIYLVKIEKNDRNKKNKATILFLSNMNSMDRVGIEATMNLTNNMVEKKEFSGVLNNYTILIIPVYNVSAYNYQYLVWKDFKNNTSGNKLHFNNSSVDLQNDFLNCNYQNSKIFTRIFQKYRPHIFIGTQRFRNDYLNNLLTYSCSHRDNMDMESGIYLNDKLNKLLENSIDTSQQKLLPIGRFLGDELNKEIKMEFNKANTILGYTTLFNCFSYNFYYNTFYMENDLLKQYSGLLDNFILKLNQEKNTILDLCNKANESIKKQESFEINFFTDSTRKLNIDFHGFRNDTDFFMSVNGNSMDTVFHKSETFIKSNLYNRFISNYEIQKPNYYIITKQNKKCMENLKLNHIQIKKIKKDTSLNLENSVFISYKKTENDDTIVYRKIVKYFQHINVHKGDVFVEPNSEFNRYLIEVLEAESDDGFSTLPLSYSLQELNYKAIINRILNYDQIKIEKLFQEHHLEMKDENFSLNILNDLIRDMGCYEFQANTFPIFKIYNPLYVGLFK